MLAGTPVVNLAIAADRPSFDISCVLATVDAGGRSRYLSDGYVTVREMDVGSIATPCKPVCATLAVGERLRLSIAGASFPAYPINPGTGRDAIDAQVDELEIVTLRLDPGGSTIFLPVAIGKEL